MTAPLPQLPQTPTLPQVSGSAEHALRALLTRELASSRIPNYLGWVCLNVATAGSTRSELAAQLERVTKSAPEEAAATVDGLIAGGLLTEDAMPSAEGQTELVSVRRRVQALSQQLTAGLSNADLATAIDVLDHVRERAEAILDS